MKNEMLHATVRRLAPFVPYLAIGLGLWAVHSAWAALLGYHAGMCAVLTFERQWGRVRDLAGGRAPATAGVAFLTGLSGGALLYLLSPLLHVAPGFGARTAALGLDAATWPWFILCFIAVNPWLEEVYWRGHLGSPSRAPAWNDLWFAGYHPLVIAGFIDWLWMLPILSVLIAAAWALRQLARWQHGLMIPALGHFAADVGIILAIYTLALR